MYVFALLNNKKVLHTKWEGMTQRNHTLGCNFLGGVDVFILELTLAVRIEDLFFFLHNNGLEFQVLGKRIVWRGNQAAQ